jgi:acetyl-CoA carboxylase, biotin carboxylase subunit
MTKYFQGISMFEKILIANRGEIALRIHRACREMGIKTVAVHSTADAAAMHVRLADESVCIGPPPAHDSYLNVAAILSAGTITGADAIHPGLGFLAEDADFATAVEEHGFTFIGPSAEHIRLMGNKVAAKDAVHQLGIPTVPGSPGGVRDLAAAEAAASAIGYPILIKAAAGGGGRGMKVARDRSELAHMLPIAQHEATSFFGCGEVYLECYLERPRHIEIQILGDGQGGIVHLGERDCSLQRSHQKVLEESPSPALNREQRDRLGELAVKALRELGYKSVGTLEFLYQDGEFFFIEMNTRLQVEHPVTEMVSGLDLVREQLRIAAGEPLGYRQSDIRLCGHAVECRINAESPDTFVPSPGRVTDYHAPGGLGVRVDSALYQGCAVPPYYDSLISKLVVHSKSRNECLMRLRRALEEYVIGGIETTIPLHQRLVGTAEFIDGDYDIHWLERFVTTATDRQRSKQAGVSI